MALSAIALVVALANAPAPTPPPPRELYFRPQHTAFFGVSVAMAFLTSPPQLNRRHPQRWFTPGPLDRRARNAFNLSTEPGEVHQGAQITGDIVGLAVPPALLVGSTLAWGFTSGATRDVRRRYMLQDLAIVFEAWGLALTTSNVMKIFVARQRPFAWAGANAEEPALTPWHEDKDQNASFPSAHSSWAFSIAVSGATVASLRRYPHWRLAWLSLIPATAVPFLRIAADQHYLSDVIVGSAIGAAYGAAVPLLIHNPRLRKRAGRVSVGPFRRGIQISGRW